MVVLFHKQLLKSVRFIVMAIKVGLNGTKHLLERKIKLTTVKLETNLMGQSFQQLWWTYIRLARIRWSLYVYMEFIYFFYLERSKIT